MESFESSSRAITGIDAVCDFLEVYIHSILHARRLYPDSLFEARFAYGIPVKASRHPELNQYISEVVAAVRTELAKGDDGLGDVMVRIADALDTTLEMFVLEISS
ncbi:MAD2 mitotic arrest deficient-like 2, partial [Linderina pennispora]